MAVPRQIPQQPKFDVPRLADFPEWVEENSKTTEFTRERDEQAAIIRERRKQLEQSRMVGSPITSDIEKAAEARVTGVLADVLPDLATLEHEQRILALTVARQTEVEEQVRQNVHRKIATACVAEDRLLVGELLAATKAIIAKFDELKHFRQQVGAAAGGSQFAVHPMRDVALNPRGIQALRHDVQYFESHAIDYAGGK